MISRQHTIALMSTYEPQQTAQCMRSLLFVQRGDIPAASAAHTLCSVLVLVVLDQTLGSSFWGRAPEHLSARSGSPYPNLSETWVSVPSRVGPLLLQYVTSNLALCFSKAALTLPSFSPSGFGTTAVLREPHISQVAASLSSCSSVHSSHWMCGKIFSLSALSPLEGPSAMLSSEGIHRATKLEPVR